MWLQSCKKHRQDTGSFPLIIIIIIIIIINFNFNFHPFSGGSCLHCSQFCGWCWNVQFSKTGPALIFFNSHTKKQYTLLTFIIFSIVDTADGIMATAVLANPWAWDVPKNVKANKIFLEACILLSLFMNCHHLGAPEVLCNIAQWTLNKYKQYKCNNINTREPEEWGFDWG